MAFNFGDFRIVRNLLLLRFAFYLTRFPDILPGFSGTHKNCSTSTGDKNSLPENEFCLKSNIDNWRNFVTSAEFTKLIKRMRLHGDLYSEKAEKY